MKIFITGKPGIGKSTVLLKTIELLRKKGLKVGGIITPEIRKEGKRVGFKVKDVYSGNEGELATIKRIKGPRLGKYFINLSEFERVALAALDFALKECDVIAIDEIGKMEFFSQRFKQKVYDIIKSDKPLIAVLHRNYVTEFRKYGELVVVTEENRDRLPEELVKKV